MNIPCHVRPLVNFAHLKCPTKSLSQLYHAVFWRLEAGRLFSNSYIFSITNWTYLSHFSLAMPDSRNLCNSPGLEKSTPRRSRQMMVPYFWVKALTSPLASSRALSLACSALSLSVRGRRWRSPRTTVAEETAPQGACCWPAIPPLKAVLAQSRSSLSQP